MDDSLKSLPVVDSNASAKAGKVPMGAVLTAIGIGVAAAAYLLVGAYWTSQAGKQSSLWLALSAAKDEKEMADLARKNSGTYLGAVAQLDMARAQLAMALREFPVAPPNDTPIITAPGADKEKDKAANDKPIDIKANLEQAVQGFDLAAKKLRSVPALERECAIGAARALESLGRFDEAKARYDELAKNPLHKDALVTLEAERRGRKLASDDYRKRLAAIQNQLRPNTP